MRIAPLRHTEPRQMASYLRGPVKTVQAWKEEMRKAGMIFHDVFGEPRNRKRRVCAFAEDLRRWRNRAKSKGGK